MIHFVILESLNAHRSVPLVILSPIHKVSIEAPASNDFLKSVGLLPSTALTPFGVIHAKQENPRLLAAKASKPQLSPRHIHNSPLTVAAQPFASAPKNKPAKLVLNVQKAKRSAKLVSGASNFKWAPIMSPSASESLFQALEPIVSASINSAAQNFAGILVAAEKRTVNLSLSSTPLETVIRILSKQTGINIVLLSKPDQKVTINVKDMGLMESLQHLAAISGLKVLKVKNALVMADDAALSAGYPKEYAESKEEQPANSPTSEGPKSPSEVNAPATIKTSKVAETTRIHTTRFMSATQISLSLKDFLQAKGVQIIALPTSLVPSIEGTGVNQGGGGGAAGGGGGGVTAGAVSNDRGNGETGSRRLLLSGPDPEVQKAIAIINELDVQRRQVEITVTIHDVANEALREEGFSWNLGQFTITENNSNSINFGTFNRTGVSFQSTIKALEKADKAKLLASPNISAMDGERAYILIGERRQFPIVNGTTPTGQFIYSTQEQNIGIYLQVSADVASDGTITLAVMPQVSAIIGFLNVNGASYPQLSTRESRSTLSMKSGDTMLLGGLLKDEEIKNLEQVPFLSRVPIFGELFKNRRTEKRTSQLIISITPKLIERQ